MAKRKKRRTIETDIFGLPTEGYEKINSKQKGNKNEREAAAWLQEWTGEPFTRVPSSGGLRWKKSSNVCGDVVCTNEDFDFPFSVETKHLKKVTLEGSLRSNSRVHSIWEQALSDGGRAGKEPLLMLRQNGMPKGEYVVYTRFNIHGIKPVAISSKLFGYNSKQLITVKFSSIRKLL